MRGRGQRIESSGGGGRVEWSSGWIVDTGQGLKILDFRYILGTLAHQSPGQLGLSLVAWQAGS